MIRSLIALTKFAALTIAGLWLIAHPGSLSFYWFSYHIETSIAVAIVGAALLILVLLNLHRLWLSIVTRPRQWKQAQALKRERNSYRNLILGLIALAAGDEKNARKAAQQLGSTALPPFAGLLTAGIAHQDGDHQNAKKQLEGLLLHKESQILALRYLIAQAQQEGAHERALELLAQAQKLSPHLPWVQEEIFVQAIEHKQTAVAKKTLHNLHRRRRMKRKNIRQQRAILMLLEAQEAHNLGPKKRVRSLIRKAFARTPQATPIAVQYAQWLCDEGKKNACTRILKRAWKANPHPELAKIAERLGNHNAPLKNYHDLCQITASREDNDETLLARAQAAIQADLPHQAQKNLDAISQPDERSARLYTHITENNANLPSSPERLRKALSTPEPSWCCPKCSKQHANWHPNCLACSSFASLIWCRPGAEKHLPQSINEISPVPEILLPNPRHRKNTLPQVEKNESPSPTLET